MFKINTITKSMWLKPKIATNKYNL
jgi:hypothetical protein